MKVIEASGLEFPAPTPKVGALAPTAGGALAGKGRAPLNRWGEPKAKAEPKRGNWVARSVIDPDFKRGVANYVPVSFVAAEWKVTPRRIRSLLAANRLAGRQQENGYWEVAYPYRFIIGTRGPVLKRQQKPKRGRPKLVEITE